MVTVKVLSESGSVKVLSDFGVVTKNPKTVQKNLKKKKIKVLVLVFSL